MNEKDLPEIAADPKVSRRLVEILPKLPVGIHSVTIAGHKLRVVRFRRVGNKLKVTK